MKHAANLLLDANIIKKKLIESASPLEDNTVWTHQKTLQALYSQLLTQYPDFSLENNVEKDLWNYGFRSTFNEIQSVMQSKKNSSEVKNIFNWFLNSTSGFFIHLLHQICSTNSLDFIFRRKDCSYGLAGGGLSALPGTKVMENSNKNALYICQYCLIHLGDLARYRHQPKQAETFYRHAVTVGPTSGHPYNQLALLEAGKGNKLAAMFLYIRALCVSAPFPGAPSNLAQTLVKILDIKNEIGTININREGNISSLTRLTKDEYIRSFLHFYASVLIKGDIESAKEDLAHLTSGLSTLVATTAVTKSSLVQMTVISIFAHNFFTGNVNVRISDDVDMKKEEDHFINIDSCKHEAIIIIEELIFGMLAALMLPVYTMKEPDLVVSFIALPSVLLNLDWLLMNKLMCSPALKKRQQIWPGICTLVNNIQSLLKNFDSKKYEDVPLPEHWDLQGFLPLQKYLSKYSYKERFPKMTVEEFSHLRASRLTDLAKTLAVEKLDSVPVIKILTNKDTGLLKFETLTNPPVEDVLVLERLTLQPHLEHKKKKDKMEKVGILKPKNFEMLKDGKVVNNKESNGKKLKTTAVLRTEVKIDSLVPTILTNDAKLTPVQQKPRVRTNVALQAILKRNSSQDFKQVTFKTNTPSGSPNMTDVSTDDNQNQISTPPGLILDAKHKSTPVTVQNTRFPSAISQSKESQFYPLAKPNEMANQPCHPFAKLTGSTFPSTASSSFPSTVPKLGPGPIGQENSRQSFKIQPNCAPLFPSDQTRLNSNDALASLTRGQPWNKDLTNYNTNEKTMDASQFLKLQSLMPSSFKDQQDTFPGLPIYMSSFNSNNGTITDNSSKPLTQMSPLSSGASWWPKDPPIRAMGSQITNQDSQLIRSPSFPSYPNVPVANINVPPPSISQIFSRPPPPIRMPQNSDSYSARVGQTFAQSAITPQGFADHFSRELPEQFRGSSTYSLFGPLGRVESTHSSGQQVLSPTNQRALPQSLWSGPSPLERLLEQKKYATKTDSHNFNSK